MPQLIGPNSGKDGNTLESVVHPEVVTRGILAANSIPLPPDIVAPFVTGTESNLDQQRLQLLFDAVTKEDQKDHPWIPSSAQSLYYCRACLGEIVREVKLKPEVQAEFRSQSDNALSSSRMSMEVDGDPNRLDDEALLTKNIQALLTDLTKLEELCYQALIDANRKNPDGSGRMIGMIWDTKTRKYQVLDDSTIESEFSNLSDPEPYYPVMNALAGLRSLVLAKVFLSATVNHSPIEVQVIKKLLISDRARQYFLKNPAERK